jgi:hypothetical protein
MVLYKFKVGGTALWSNSALMVQRITKLKIEETVPSLSCMSVSFVGPLSRKACKLLLHCGEKVKNRA